MRKLTLAAAALVLPLAGCGLLSDPPGEKDATMTDASSIDTTFTRIGQSGYIDLSLELTNDTDQPLLILDADLVARDADGEELPGVRVRTAFRTPLGGAVVMPGVAVDFVQLEGEGEEDVRDVTLEGGLVAPLPDTEVAAEPVDLVPLDRRGSELEYDAAATQVRLDNPNPVDVRTRVVLMVLGTSPEGQPQEADLVRDDATVDVPAGGSVTVDLDPRTIRLLRTRGRDAFVTLRPVAAPPS